MDRQLVRPSLLCLLAFVLISFAACKGDMAEEEEPPATTEMDTTEIMGTDMGTDMTTSEPMGTDAEEYPKFPWPPPEASASTPVPRRFLVNPGGAATLLSDVNRRLTDALERNGYFESSYYSVPQGFALVTKMEQINPNGAARQGSNRWVSERQPLQEFSLRAYLRALFGAAPGRYRVIVFIVTPHPFSQSEVKVTANEASRWLQRGVDQLPTSIGRMSFAAQNYKCTALIYEFERRSDVAEPSLRRPSPLLGRTHLEKAGIWGGLAK